MASDGHRPKYRLRVEAQLRHVVVETIARDLAKLYQEESEPSPELQALLRKFREREEAI